MERKAFKYTIGQNFCFYSVAIVVFLTGIWLRTEYLSRHLEYDEIWTLTHYITKPIAFIFSDLATPNNHPLSTLLGKIFTDLFGNGIIVQRIPAFISGTVLLIVITLLSYVIIKNRFCALLALIFSALNGGLIYYSQTARGYELQTFLILTFIYLLILREKYELKNFLFVIAFSLVGIASILTLSTSIVFIFPIILIHLSYLIASYYSKEKNFLKTLKKILTQENIISGYLLIGGFSLVWFAFNYQQYKQGQSHGTSIDTTKQFLIFGYETLLYLVPLPVLLLSIVPVFFKKHINFGLAYFLLIVFTLGSAFVFKAGPPRIYLPLIPIICFAGSYGAYLLVEAFKKKISLIIKTVFILVSFSYLFLYIPDEHRKWFAIDWQKVYNSLAQNLPYNYYLYLPAVDGYPASYHNDFGIVENAKRTPHTTGFIVALQEGINANSKEVIFTGIEPSGSNSGEIKFSQNKSLKTIEIPIFNCSVVLFSIISISQTDTLANITLMAIFPAPALKFTLDVSKNKAIVLNSWFIRTNFLPITLLLKNNAISKEEMLQIEKQSKGHILFFTIKEASEGNYIEFRNRIEKLLLPR